MDMFIYLDLFPIYRQRVLEKERIFIMLDKIVKDKPKLEKPLSFITLKDRRLVWQFFLLSLLCIVPILNPFKEYPWALNQRIFIAIPSQLSLFMPFIAPAIYYGIIVMERCYFRELVKIEARQLEQLRKKQKIHFTARYRDFEEGSCWEITNRSSFSWNNAKLIIERTQGSSIDSEKHPLGNIPALRRISINSNLNRGVNSQWRVMILSEEGHTIDFPERYEKLQITMGE